MVPKPKEYELQAVLCALYAKCNDSIHCHVPLEAIKAKLRRELWPILRIERDERKTSELKSKTPAIPSPFKAMYNLKATTSMFLWLSA